MVLCNWGGIVVAILYNFYVMVDIVEGRDGTHVSTVKYYKCWNTFGLLSQSDRTSLGQSKCCGSWTVKMGFSLFLLL